MPRLAKNNVCTGCLACVDVCKHNAIHIEKKHELLYPIVDPLKCIECKLCEKCCPIITPISLNEVENIHVYGGWSSNEEIRVAGASGGTFAGLAIGLMTSYAGNSSIYGATMENNRVYHRRITSAKELPSLMNSKYIQSNTSGVYKLVKKDLKDGLRVLFSGTPCQIAGLYGFLGKLRNHENLITVELICAGVLSPEALDIHLESFKSSKIYSFRNKITGQCTTIDIGGVPYRFTKRHKDIFYRCFSSSILERRSCHDCKFAKLTRVADITIGDFWGGVRDLNEYEKGVNVILTNNLRADLFLRSLNTLELYKTTIGKAISGNPCLYSNFNYVKYHPLVIWPNVSRKILPKKVWTSIVVNNNPWRYLWGVYRLLSIIRQKRAKKKLVNRYENIIDE